MIPSIPEIVPGLSLFSRVGIATFSMGSSDFYSNPTAIGVEIMHHMDEIGTYGPISGTVRTPSTQVYAIDRDPANS